MKKPIKILSFLFFIILLICIYPAIKYIKYKQSKPTIIIANTHTITTKDFSKIVRKKEDWFEPKYFVLDVNSTKIPNKLKSLQKAIKDKNIDFILNYEKNNKLKILIPDYSNDDLYKITNINDYYKYNKGYCLKEDRILSKEERFKRGINQYLDKRLQADKMIGEYRCTFSLYSCANLNYPPYNDGDLIAGYYKLPELKSNDPFGDMIKKYKKDKKRTALKKLFFNIYSATLADPKDYLTINIKDMTGRFSVPFIRFTGGPNFNLYLNKGFVLFNDFSFYGKDYFMDEYYSDMEYERKKYNPKANHNPNNHARNKIDNCGNVNFNVKKYYRENKEPGL